MNTSSNIQDRNLTNSVSMNCLDKIYEYVKSVAVKLAQIAYEALSFIHNLYDKMGFVPFLACGIGTASIGIIFVAVEIYFLGYCLISLGGFCIGYCLPLYCRSDSSKQIKHIKKQIDDLEEQLVLNKEKWDTELQEVRAYLAREQKELDHQLQNLKIKYNQG